MSFFLPGVTPVLYAGHVTDHREIEAGTRALKKGWLGLGSEGDGFQRELASLLGCKCSLLTNSGSSANLLAVSALTSHKLGDRRLRKGDEVITCALGFPTTVAPIVQNNLVPVFVDCDPLTLNARVEQLEEALSPKTKAVMMAHTLGNPFDVEQVQEFCGRHGLWLIEDNCLAAGTRVATSSGEKNIEEIRRGDFVLTRSGYRRVLEAQKTGYKPVITRLGITATPDHPVITELGCKRLDALSASDTVFAWNEKPLSTKEELTSAILNPFLLIGADTFGLTPDRRFHPPSIVRYGSTTLVQFLLECISTTKTAIRSITTSRTSKCFQANSTASTISPKIGWRSSGPIWHWHGSKLPNGISRKRVGSFIGESPPTHGRTSLFLKRFVRFAEHLIKPIFRPDLSIAPSNARAEVDVYNLKVEGASEFFANGILVHNCDALGSTYKGQMTGSFGDLSTQSFYPPHHITMGEGGAVNVRDNSMLRKLVESFRDWGRDCWCDPGKDNTCGKRFGWHLGELPEGYDHKYSYAHFGYNLKPTEVQAAIGRVQLAKLDGFGKARRENWRHLRVRLHDLPFDFQQFDDAANPCWFGFMIRVRDGRRNALATYLENDRKIGCRMMFGGNLTRQPMFVQLRKDDPNAFRVVSDLSGADHVMNNALFIGVYPGLTEEMLDYMVQSIREFVA